MKELKEMRKIAHDIADVQGQVNRLSFNRTVSITFNPLQPDSLIYTP